MSKSKKLGRGLGALLGDDLTAERTEKLKISLIVPNEYQPRHTFNDEALGELAASIAEHGLLQPIAVRPRPRGGYSIW